MSLSTNNVFTPRGTPVTSDSRNTKLKVTEMTVPMNTFVLPMIDTTTFGSPIEGMIAYDINTKKINVYNGSDWEEVTSST